MTTKTRPVHRTLDKITRITPNIRFSPGQLVRAEVCPERKEDLM
jgi:hypothetical protein